MRALYPLCISSHDRDVLITSYWQNNAERMIPAERVRFLEVMLEIYIEIVGLTPDDRVYHA